MHQVTASDRANGSVFSGSTQASTQSNLSFKVTGQIRRIAVNVGQQVKKGQLIAELDDADLRLKLKQAQAAYAQASAQARNAQALYKRQQRLYENQSVSIQTLEDARAQAQSTRASLGAQGQAVRLQRSQLAYCKLVAPTAGRIAQLPANQGENISAGKPVAVLNAGGNPEVAINVSERAIGAIKVGDSATVSIAAVPNARFDAKVTEVGVSAQSTGYPVTLTFSGDTSAIRAGMTAEVRLLGKGIQKQAEPAALLVPAIAVMEDQKGRFLFAVKGGAGSQGTVERRTIKVGKLRDRGVEVSSGVKTRRPSRCRRIAFYRTRNDRATAQVTSRAT